jgi:flagellar biosynthesis protein FliQ
MTELEVLQQIQQGIEAVVIIMGFIVGLLISILFAKAWGENTHG